MSEAPNNLHEVDLKINSMNKDIEQIDKLCYKLTESIEKLQEVNISLTRMITLHEEKLDQRIRIEDQTRSEIRDIHSRITTMGRELTDKIERIESVKSVDITSKVEMNKYHYMLIGAATGIGWLLSHINLIELANLLK